MNTKFTIEGMSCTACAAAIERTTSKLEGVQSAVVNFATEKLDVQYNPEAISIETIEDAVDKIGYKAIAEVAGNPVKKETDHTQEQVELMRNRMIFSLLFAVPLFYLSMGPMIGLPIPSFLAGEKNIAVNALTQLLLCLPVLYVGAHFYIDGYKALWHRIPNMDSLIAVGTSASFIYSIYVFYHILEAISYQDMMMLHHYAHDIYFESTVVILALISVGKYMETRAKGKTSQAIEKLIELTPDEATILKNGKQIVVPVEDVLVGDTILIKPGERIPVDGVVLEGNSSVDESLLTGESIPVEKEKGSIVNAGTINKTGSFSFEASRVGEDTSLAKIIELVEQAQSSKAPIARLADKISRYFVPAVMGIALAAFLFWLLMGYGFSFALSIGIAVLVISCPCALGLATPTAIMVGTGVGARNGILFKNGEALETLGKTDYMVLDKTGTITEGTPRVTDILTFGSFNKDELLKLAASLESHSEHPLSEAIIDKALQQDLPLEEIEEFNSLTGRGITGRIGNYSLAIGNSLLMKEIHAKGIDYETDLDRLAKEGKTPLVIAINSRIEGIIAAADPLKENAQKAIGQLQALGLEVYMLTGDNKNTAQAIAKQAGIKHVIAEVLPDQKAAVVAKLKENDKQVTMVGDGINDAPALVEANNGIAIGTGTDVAIESADIILMQSDLFKLPTSVELSRATLKNVKMNLFWAFFYNTICIPVAAGILYIPFGFKLNAMVAAGAMSLSSVSVLLNALSLRGFKPKELPIENTEITPVVQDINEFLGLEIKPQNNPLQGKEIDMEVTLKVNDMSCQHCVARVNELLMQEPGVLGAQVDLDKGEATIEVEPGTDLEKISQVVTEAGYPTHVLAVD